MNMDDAENNSEESFEHDDSENSNIDTPEELEQKKLEMNGYNVQGNSAQNQIFIKDVGSGGLTVNYNITKMVPVESQLPIEKQYDLTKCEDCIEFVETFKNSEYFVTAIVLSIMESVKVKDLPDLKEKITPYLPQEDRDNMTDGDKQSLNYSSYISLNTVLAVIKAKQFTAEDGQTCVSIGNKKYCALENMLQQFPILCVPVKEFIVQLIQEDRYNTVFYDQQISTLLIEIITLDFIDLEDEILPMIYRNPARVNLLGLFAYRLYILNKEKANDYLFYWLHLGKTWMWKAVCWTYLLLREY